MGKAPEYWDLVSEGLADMAIFSCAYNPARFQMSTFVELPFFSTSSRMSYDVVQALLAKNLITSEFEPLRLFVHVMSPPSQIFTNKEITKVEDFKGTRFFGPGSVWNKTLGLLGAKGVSMGMQDVYLALERGTLDAAANNWASVMSYRWVEVVKYPVEINFMGGYFNMLIMSNKSWSKVSPEVRAAWTKINEKYGPRMAATFDGVESVAKKVWTDAGKKIEMFPAAEREKLSSDIGTGLAGFLRLDGKGRQAGQGNLQDLCGGDEEERRTSGDEAARPVSGLTRNRARNQRDSLHKGVEEMDRFISAVSQKLHFLSGMAVIAMVLIMSLDVISRYVLMTSLLDTIEISSMLLGAVVSLALPSVTDMGEHIRFSLLTERLSTRARGLAKAVALMISTTVFSLLTWQATIRGISGLRSGEFIGSLQIPIWPGRFLFAFGCLLTALVLLTQLIYSFSRPRSVSSV